MNRIVVSSLAIVTALLLSACGSEPEERAAAAPATVSASPSISTSEDEDRVLYYDALAEQNVTVKDFRETSKRIIPGGRCHSKRVA